MKNICANEMVVYGPKEDVVEFLKRVRNAMGGRDFASDFFLSCGYEEDELVDLAGFGPMWLTRDPESFEESAAKPAHVVLRFDTELCPAFDAWDDLLKCFFPTLRQVTYAEVAGTGCYYNTDTEGIFFQEE